LLLKAKANLLSAYGPIGTNSHVARKSAGSYPAAKSRFAHLASDGPPIWTLFGFAGAFSTAAHAGGKSLIFKPFADPEFSGIFRRRIQSENQEMSDLSHPSPDGTAG
jgi:hypothetical protein